MRQRVKGCSLPSEQVPVWEDALEIVLLALLILRRSLRIWGHSRAALGLCNTSIVQNLWRVKPWIARLKARHAADYGLWASWLHRFGSSFEGASLAVSAFLFGDFSCLHFPLVGLLFSGAVVSLPSQVDGKVLAQSSAIERYAAKLT
eukprot:scaffold41170_cov21-Tisochrysis_lutea.AAC.1